MKIIFLDIDEMQKREKLLNRTGTIFSSYGKKNIRKKE